MKAAMPYLDAYILGKSLCEQLLAICERAEIAGSLRREKRMVGDIEIVCEPKSFSYKDLLGTDIYYSKFTPAGLMEIFGSKTNVIKAGAKYIQFIYKKCFVDLFAATQENWGYIQMLRTGNALFSKKMVTSVQAGGLKPSDIHVSGGWVYERGDLVAVPDEECLFKLWKLEFIPPELREIENDRDAVQLLRTFRIGGNDHDIR